MGGMSKEKLFSFDIARQVKNNYALVPLVFVIGFGTALCSWQMFRTVTKSPDIIVNRRGNPHPYEYLEKDGEYKRYKYFSTINYKNLHPDPDRPKLD
jgi:hypothetical protein